MTDNPWRSPSGDDEHTRQPDTSQFGSPTPQGGQGASSDDRYRPGTGDPFGSKQSGEPFSPIVPEETSNQPYSPNQPTPPNQPNRPDQPAVPGAPVPGGTNPFQHTAVAPGYDPKQAYGEPEKRTFLQRVSHGPGWGILAGLIWTILMVYVFFSDQNPGSLTFFLAILAPPIVLLFVNGWRRFALGWLIVFALSPIVLAGVCIAFFAGLSFSGG